MGSLYLKETRNYPYCGKESDKKDDPQVWYQDTQGCGTCTQN